MTTRRMDRLAALAIIVLAALTVGERTAACAPKKPAGGDEWVVAQYMGARRGTAWGRPTMRIFLKFPTGKTANLAAVKESPMSTVYDPHPEIVKVVKELKKGDYVRISTAVFQGVGILRGIRKYLAKRGEDSADGFVFVESTEVKAGRRTYTSVVLSKYGVTQTVLVPKVKGEDGKMVDDAKIAEAVTALKKDSVVEATVMGKGRTALLEFIAPWKPPRKGEFVKLVPASGEQKQMAVEVKVDGEAQTLLVPNLSGRSGKAYPDPKIVRAVRRLRAGDAVEFRTREEDGKTLLRRIDKGKGKGKGKDKKDK